MLRNAYINWIEALILPLMFTRTSGWRKPRHVWQVIENLRSSYNFTQTIDAEFAWMLTRTRGLVTGKRFCCSGGSGRLISSLVTAVTQVVGDRKLRCRQFATPLSWSGRSFYLLGCSFRSAIWLVIMAISKSPPKTNFTNKLDPIVCKF